ncbi:hypothetical protein OIU76_003947 [Salix suchowensis]|uniref:Dirigent protein n=1 Tax=Salix suchowensis TaxID=1278906 RepID=A0ABQ9BNL0_9ROSI|nr:disease resistance response protein [Salix suchowensis]KAJ6326679.1 hypothetical protein OIU78_013716 [Salix suchowensis]KAJ6347364.1 hypothetical protein OIU76_003947 [Salix suchowensis]KAJ6388585.1 hypothetical protein OIU77_027026 [Salix suchowensis]
MAATVLISALLLFLLICSSNISNSEKTRRPEPCKRLVVYFHDIVYNGKNAQNATSAIVASPAWGNKTTLATPNFFGDVVVFDNPLTLDNNLRSTPVGRAQGFYLYDRKDFFSAWFGFSFLFNSTRLKGAINVAGADDITKTTRDLSVVGGTGDFFMTRGVATLTTDAVEDDRYFRLRVDVKLYECY